MAKKSKKNIRLRKRIRRTLGTVCLITALLVAMIPVPDATASVGAAGSDGSLLIWDNLIWSDVAANRLSNIPLIPKNCETIYTTGDGMYQFAFVNESANSSNKIAVILGYSGGALSNNALVIPDTVDAYTKYNINDSTYGGYVAVSKSQKPLFYRVDTEINTPSGNDVITEIKTEYRPCYFDDKSKWEDKSLTDFYYYDSVTATYIKTDSQDEQWIRQIVVAFIGNQSLMSKDITGTGAYVGWEIAEETDKLNTIPEKGVFANKGNIVNLTIGDKLRGIGNYAFYGCTGIQSITLGNGLIEIGKNAFEGCNNMKSVNLNVNSNITYISDNAFKNCRSLTSFQVPVNVKAIYDSAFEGCSSLQTIDLAGIETGQRAALQKMGYYVFKGCSLLESITLPESLTGDGTTDSDVVWLNNFIGCSNLRAINVQSTLTKFSGTANFPVETLSGGVTGFKDSVHSTFFMSCKDISETHRFTKENAIAFKYADEDRYEIIIRQEAVDGGDKATIIYQVNSGNELLYFDMDKAVGEVVIPSTIGPFGVSAIRSDSFSNNCFLRKITIPATVTRIMDNAFKGCHNLRHVIFGNASTITEMGTNAFATQLADSHSRLCPNNNPAVTTGENAYYLSKTPELTFTGTVGSQIVPFQYAMSAGSNINAGSQPITYIKYYSGWPNNLEVMYNKDKGKAELNDYPTRAALQSGKYNITSYPYMTQEYMDAAMTAMDKYDRWKVDNNVEITGNEWNIINSVLNISIPDGVTAIKTGLFSGVKGAVNSEGAYTGEPEKVSAAAEPDKTIETITLASIDEFEPFSFSGCEALHTINITGGANHIAEYGFAYGNAIVGEEGLVNFNMTGGGGTIGNYAFKGNSNLTNVTLSPTVNKLGVRPFVACPKVKSVSFSGGPYFVTDNSIIFGLQDNVKTSVAECLEMRGKGSASGTVGKAEMSGITEIAPEAFMGCPGIGSADFSASSIKNVPVNAFAQTKNLYSVMLPRTCNSISKLAFQDSNLQYIEIPSSVTYMDPLAFNTETNPNSENTYNTITFYCEPGSAAEIFANEYESIIITDKPIEKYFTVIFWGNEGQELKTEEVLMGKDANPPEPPAVEGHTFDGWLPDYTNVSRDMDIVAQYSKIDSEDTKHTVTFIDYDDSILYTQKVENGKDAIIPIPPTREGHTFTGWRPAITNITKSMETYAQYEKIGGGTEGTRHTVTFIDYDDKVLYTQMVDDGKDAIIPMPPTREGHTFTGWRPAITNITKSMETFAMYDKNSGSSADGTTHTVTFYDHDDKLLNTQTVENGKDAVLPTPPTRTGYTFKGWRPAVTNVTKSIDTYATYDKIGDNGDGTTPPTPSTLYTLTITNGSGSGSYVAGATVIIVANEPASTQQFSQWTTDNKDIKFASNKVAATTMVMPAANATVTATFEKKSGTTTGGGNAGNNNGSNTVTKNDTTNKGGTTVVIDKNGLSNTGVVSATVNGSSDNFVIKISEDTDATEAAIKALIDEYGSLDNLKYFPMDISLYDAKGEKKITDTTGLSITITLPIPDSLIPYAGNNKVASVVNDKLDKLAAKFTTINKVSCVTFTAEHFSPYVIYVNTQNLSASGSGEADDSPKTGDIHPKWFFVIGLCCVSIILFAKRDKTKSKKVAHA